MKLLHRALGASPSCSLVLTLEAVLCASQEDSMRRYFYFFMHTFISLPITLFLFLPSLSFAHSIIWLAQANIIIRNGEEKASTDISTSRKRTINHRLMGGPQAINNSVWSHPRPGPWGGPSSCITLTPSHSPFRSLPGLWRPSIPKGSNLISLFMWCSLNWISQAWVTTAKVPHFLLCWVTNGAVQPTGGDTAVAVMTPWLVWAQGPQPTWTESQTPQFKQWARQTHYLFWAPIQSR